MLPDLGLGAVFLVGLLGGGHCAGMCGGVVSALTAQPGTARARLHFAYSAGRIASYSAAGAIAGSIGGLGMLFSSMLPVQLALYVLANVMLLVLGLYLAGVSSLAMRLESAGQVIWRRLQPLTHRLIPATTLPRALGVGALWGWIPCGLVYSVLTLAMLSGSATDGALVMLFFGLGTVPSLLLAGMLMRTVKSVLQGRTFRQVCGALVFGFGASGLVHAFDLTDRIRAGLLCLT